MDNFSSYLYKIIYDIDTTIAILIVLSCDID